MSVVGLRPVFELANVTFYYYVGGEIGIATYFENGLLKKTIDNYNRYLIKDNSYRGL